MSTYQEILNQAQSLTPEEQELLLKDLTLLIHQRESIKNSPQLSKLNLARWRGFLPKASRSPRISIKTSTRMGCRLN